ncbi:MAG: Ig-like domain-containing protein [Gemmatimonadaceae bacterium]
MRVAFVVAIGGCSLLEAPQSQVDALSIDPAGGATFAKGDKPLHLHAIASVAGRLVPAITANWESFEPGVVSVDKYGYVTAVGPGSATVRVRVQGQSADTKITVVREPRLWLQPSGPLAMDVGQTASLSPVDSAGPDFWNSDALGTVRWESKDTAVATVSQHGDVTAIAAGTTRIVASSRDDTASVTLQVATGNALAVTPPFRTLEVGTVAHLDATAGPVGPPPTVEWSSSDPAIATASAAGSVTAVAPGLVQITASNPANSQLRGTATIVVLPSPVATVRIIGDDSLSVGRSRQVTAVLLDSAQKATSARITWRSSTPDVAVVSEDGIVTGIQKGKSTIEARAGGKRGSLNVTVGQAQTTISLEQLQGGGNHTCGLTKDGAAYCWGANAKGQLGDSTLPRRTNIYLVDGGQRFKQLTTGFEHTCGITLDGDALCWGDNSEGQLGDGTTANHSMPTLVNGGRTFSALVAGVYHTCGLSDRIAYCWGSNSSGQLGDGSFVSSTVPVLVAGRHTFEQIGAGVSHTCAFDENGAPFCWGANAGAQLGDSTRSLRPFPDSVKGKLRLKLKELTVGWQHACGLTKDGGAYCWGRDYTGQLGNSKKAAPVDPQPVAGGLKFKMVTVAGLHSCGLTERGVAYCWGSNVFGEIGNGDARGHEQLEPSRVAGNLLFEELTAGFGHTCGREKSGVMYCWGDNTSGQLGDGTVTLRRVPTLVQ